MLRFTRFLIDTPLLLILLLVTHEARAANNAIWLSWVDLFKDIGPRMTGEKSQ